jgi:hypothetical protein
MRREIMKPVKALRVAEDRPPGSRGSSFRLLPVTLAAVLVMLTLKVGDVWTGFSALTDGLRSNEANAQIRSTDPTAGAQKPEIVAKAATGPEAFPNPSRFTQEEIEALNQLAMRRDQLDRPSPTGCPRPLAQLRRPRRREEPGAEDRDGERLVGVYGDAGKGRGWEKGVGSRC